MKFSKKDSFFGPIKHYKNKHFEFQIIDMTEKVILEVFKNKTNNERCPIKPCLFECTSVKAAREFAELLEEVLEKGLNQNLLRTTN